MKKTHVFTEFLFCLFPELSPWGHSTKTLQSNYLDLEGRGGEAGGWWRGRAQLGEGVKAQRERNQEPPARLNTAPAAKAAAWAPGSHC